MNYQGFLTNTNENKYLNDSKLIITIGLALVAFAATVLMNVNGIFITIMLLLVGIISAYLYDKPQIMLFASLFVFPFTRLFSLHDKFVITGLLYTLSFPCFIWLVFKLFGKVKSYSPHLVFMIAYSVVVALNLFRPSVEMVELLKEFGRMYFAIFIILGVYDYVKGKTQLLQLSKYFSYLFNSVAVIAIAQYIFKFGGIVTEGFYRARGVFFNFNEYGYILSVFVCFALLFFFTEKNSKIKAYWGGSILLNLMALMVTLSKTAILNTVIVFLVMSFFLSTKRKLQFASVGAISIIALGVFLFSTGAFEALSYRLFDTTSLNWRYDMWRNLTSMIAQGNFLFGEGLNASRIFLQHIVATGESYAPHNVYLEVLYNMGLAALVPFVLIFLAVIKQGFNILNEKSNNSNLNKMIGAAIIVIVSITMIQNFVSNAFYDRSINIIFWAILSLLVCCYKYYNDENSINSKKEKINECSRGR